jgi:Spy/CpxP family protein refolding chaperone
MKNRYSFRLLTIGTMLIVALTAPAQQTSAGPGGALQDGAPKVEPQLKTLTNKLDLTGDQQARIKPILQELRDATQKVMKDESMSRDERLDHVKTSRYRADKQIREILSDDQRIKLDQLESEPHPELHGE